MTARPMFNRSAARSVASRGLAGDPATCACGAALQFGTDGDGGVVEYCDACHRARPLVARVAPRVPPVLRCIDCGRRPRLHPPAVRCARCRDAWNRQRTNTNCRAWRRARHASDDRRQASPTN